MQSRTVTVLAGLSAGVAVLVAAVVVLWPAPAREPAAPVLPDLPDMVQLAVDERAVAVAECQNGMDWRTDPVRGSVVTLNGSNEYCATAGAMVDTTASYSVSAWVKLAAHPGKLAMAAVGQDGTNASGFYLQYSWYHRKWAFNWMAADVIDPVDNATATSDEPVTTQWTHLVGTYDAKTKRIQVYVNGVAGTTRTIGKPWRAAGPLTIGRAKWNGEPGNYLRGDIDGVRLWTRALRPDEVVELFKAPPNP
ncbi:LamG domain-containing protein [Micromonospora sp. NPDC049051]|uniref:LamG domain-containing protein n=1 Tax=Micromonospora sp. NPDC049051 TaxID=3364264 RepID=UPI003713AF61